MCCYEDTCSRCGADELPECELFEKLVGKLCRKCAREYEQKLFAIARASFSPRGTTFGLMVLLYKLETEDTAMQQRMIAEIAYSAYARTLAETMAVIAWRDLVELDRLAWAAATTAVRNLNLAQPLAEAFDRLGDAIGEDLTIKPGEMIEVAMINRAIEKLEKLQSERTAAA